MFLILCFLFCSGFYLLLFLFLIFSSTLIGVHVIQYYCSVLCFSFPGCFCSSPQSQHLNTQCRTIQKRSNTTNRTTTKHNIKATGQKVRNMPLQSWNWTSSVLAIHMLFSKKLDRSAKECLLLAAIAWQKNTSLVVSGLLEITQKFFDLSFFGLQHPKRKVFCDQKTMVKQVLGMYDMYLSIKSINVHCV